MTTPATIEKNLNDGTPVFIRLFGPGDLGALKIGFEKLSPRSRYQRFFSAFKCLPQSVLDDLGALDNRNRLAQCAYVEEQGQPVGIGIARYCRPAPESESAEFAISVIDGYQGRGAGGLLMAFLTASARQNGIRVLTGYVLEENRPMLKLLKRLGATLKRDAGGVLKISLPVDGSAGHKADDPGARRK